MIDRATLPTAVHRWLDRAVVADTHLPEGWIVDQRGEMELRPDRWGTWTAEEEFVVRNLGFEWRGKVKVGPMVWMKVSDGLALPIGWGRARIWGIVPMINQKGEHLARAQLVRNLTDLPFAPQVAAVVDLGWEPDGDDTAVARVPVGDRIVEVRFEVDPTGDPISTSVADRPRNLPGRKELVDTPYRVEFSDYAEFTGARIPTKAEAFWDLADGSRAFNRINVIGAGPAS
jgi:hypothetical protein